MLNRNVIQSIFIKTAIMALSLMVLLPLNASADISLVFGTYAAEKPTVTVQKLRPILNALENEMTTRTGEVVHIRLNVSRNYDTAIQDLLSGNVDFARFGQAAYVMAKAAQPELDIISVEGDHALKSFRSMIVVRSESSIRNVSELRGASFAFGSKYSTTGRYLPQSFLSSKGITARMLKKFAYLGRHDRVASAVTDGLFEAGAISEWVYKELIAKGEKLRSIASFSSVTKPWVARKGLPSGIRHLISNSLVALKDLPILGRIKKDCFLPGKDHDYVLTRHSIANNWTFFDGGSDEIFIETALKD